MKSAAARSKGGLAAKKRPAPKTRRKPTPKPARARAKTKGKPLRVIVTAGPTREHIDPVRYLSNESSGKMGFAIAAAAKARGHRVTLIAGPVNLATPKGVKRVDVVSARDMLAAMKFHFAEADALVMAAAVADYRPTRKLAGKWKKKISPNKSAKGGTSIQLDLTENPDLLATVGRKKAGRCLIGFALETSQGRKRALEKMLRKNADAIVLNGPSALNANRTTVTLIERDGAEAQFKNKTKAEVARALVRALERIAGPKGA